MGIKIKDVDVIRPGSINAIIGPVGTLKRILNNQDYFNDRGYQVTVFANESIQNGPILVPPPAKKAVVSWKSELRNKVGSIIRMHAKKNKWLAIWMYKKGLKNAEMLVDYYLTLDRDPDIIQFHSGAECYYYLKKRKNKRAKTVMFIHGDGIPFEMDLQYYPILRNTNFIEKQRDVFEWTVSNTDRIVFIARIGQENFLKFYPNRNKQNTTVIINGIDDMTAEQKEEINIIKKDNVNSLYKYRLCCTGTINTRKGQRYIIEALHELPLDIQNHIHVDFIGEGGERPVLEDLVKKYGLEKNVTFYGLIPNVDVYKYLAQNNIYILMSQNEGLPISILEAMRAGLPVISTKVSGIPELVNEGYNGFLLNPDSKELAKLLKNLSESNWLQMGANSRKRFENEFTFERMRKELCDMYDCLF